MNNKDNIRFITLPEDFKADFGDFKFRREVELPLLLPEGKEEMGNEDLSVENLIAGMVTIIAHHPEHDNAAYYRDFVLALDQDIVKKLNQAAIAKEQRKEFEFAEELFLAVYHLLPQNASLVNLATLYSYLAVEARNNGEDEKYWIKKVRETLEEGIEKFGEDEMILSELTSFEAYMGNLEEAKDYAERYLSVAEEGEKKEEMKKLLKEISFKIDNSDAINEAYDFISLNEPEKALPIIERFVEANPTIWNGYFLKGWALRINKEFTRAKECFLKCMELGESNAEIYNELSLCELEEGSKELAKAYLETACDLDEGNLTTATNLAFLYLGDGEFDEARVYLERARYLAKDDRFVKGLIKEYEKATGEKIGDVIHEEYVANTENPEEEDYPGHDFSSSFQALRESMEEDWEDENECCSHHEEGGGCCPSHHHDHDCHSGSHKCSCGHCGDDHSSSHDDNHCCCNKD